MKKKILSLCIPTYNRDWCVNEQIERLKLCPKDILDRIEIIISDNCSIDHTQQIVEQAIADGFPCHYIRNDVNLGMDANFINCCKRAMGQYVWILGDDDIIILDFLVHVVNKLDVSTEYGLLHISQNNNLQEDFVCLSDKNDMMRIIGYYLTFISSNIVNTKYIPLVEFEKYIGTLFSLVPLYLTALTNASHNAIIKGQAFDGGRDYGRGGYNFYVVFVQNYLTILADYVPDRRMYKYLKRNVWPFIWLYTKQLIIDNEVGNFQIDNGCRILLKYYGTEWYFWWGIAKYTINNIKKIII